MNQVWDSFIQHNTLEEVLNDNGLAKTGDAIVNLCYSLAKSLILGRATGEKVRDDVLAKAIRETPLYERMNKRTDRGTAADSYEAVIAYLWMSKKVTIEFIVNHLTDNLSLDTKTSRKKEVEIASKAFKLLLESLIPLITI